MGSQYLPMSILYTLIVTASVTLALSVLGHVASAKEHKFLFEIYLNLMALTSLAYLLLGFLVYHYQLKLA